MPQTLGAVSNRESSVQVLVHSHRAAGQGGSPAHRLDLQAQVLNTHRVVPVDRTLLLQGEDQVQIFAGATHKCTATFPCRDLETSVKFRDIVFAQETVGGF